MLLLAACLLSPPAFSLENEWLAIWRRLEDRGGRPAPRGAQLQWADDLQYLEYPFDQGQAGFPLGRELAWQAAPRGARLYVQSITEFTLTHAIELKDAWDLGAGLALGVRYHQLGDRQTRSHLPRLVFEGAEVAGTPAFFELHLFPRWDKEDADVEALVGLRWAAWGEARVRIAALDPFVNASYALAESRGAALSEVFEQADPGLVLALELASARWHGLRGELYGGTRLTTTTERTVPDDPAAADTHRESGRLAGALLEWAGPVTLGATVLHVAAEDTWRGARRGVVEEARTAARFYGLAAVAGAALEAQLQVITLDFRDTLDAPYPPPGGEHAWGEVRRVWSVRGWWPAEGVVAAELGVLRSERAPTGVPPPYVEDAAGHRLVTRVALNLPPLWLALGVGWDLEPEDGRYDGGGLTVTLVE